MRKPKVLIAASIYPPDAGGPAIHAKAQYEGLPQLGIETELVALAHYRKWPPGLRHYIYLVKLLSKGWDCDVVYAHDAVGVGIPALIASTVLNKKLILRVGGDLAWERAGEKENISLREWYEKPEHKKNLMYRLSRAVLLSAHGIIVPSRILADLYSAYYGIDARKIKLITNPIPQALKTETVVKNEIVFGSRLVAYKNLDLVLQAFAPIFREHADLKLVILGEGPEREPLEKAAENLAIRERVEFAGQVTQEEVLRRTSTCLFTIAPALTEFNPNYVLQGIGMGKPFIISWENGLSFDVPEYLTFNPRSVEELREKVSNILKEEEYEKARTFLQNIRVTTTWDENLKENLNLINSLLNGSK